MIKCQTYKSVTKKYWQKNHIRDGSCWNHFHMCNLWWKWNAVVCSKKKTGQSSQWWNILLKANRYFVATSFTEPQQIVRLVAWSTKDDGSLRIQTVIANTFLSAVTIVFCLTAIMTYKRKHEWLLKHVRGSIAEPLSVALVSTLKTMHGLKKIYPIITSISQRRNNSSLSLNTSNLKRDSS